MADDDDLWDGVYIYNEDSEDELDDEHFLTSSDLEVEQHYRYSQSHKEEMLIKSIAQGNEISMMKWLHLGAGIETRDDNDKSTVLIMSAAKGNMRMVWALLDRGCDVNAVNMRNQSALMKACVAGSLEIVKLLIEHEAEIENVDEYGCTPLLRSCRAGHLHIIKYLVARGADLRVVDLYNCNCLMWAARFGRAAAVSWILSLDILHIDSQDSYRNTALIAAAQSSFVDKIQYAEATVKVLLHHQANTALMNGDGKTALDIAMERKRHTVVNLLLNYST